MLAKRFCSLRHLLSHLWMKDSCFGVSRKCMQYWHISFISLMHRKIPWLQIHPGNMLSVKLIDRSSERGHISLCSRWSITTEHNWTQRMDRIITIIDPNPWPRHRTFQTVTSRHRRKHCTQKQSTILCTTLQNIVISTEKRIFFLWWCTRPG